MKTLYLECNMGATGDMLAAALLEIHPQPDEVVCRLNHMGLPGVEFFMEPYRQPFQNVHKRYGRKKCRPWS